jgi:hypothetical protein
MEDHDLMDPPGAKLYRRFECAAAGPHGCLYYFHVRLTTTSPILHYGDQDEFCAGQ